jgi:hypothetical protein
MFRSARQVSFLPPEYLSHEAVRREDDGLRPCARRRENIEEWVLPRIEAGSDEESKVIRPYDGTYQVTRRWLRDCLSRFEGIEKFVKKHWLVPMIFTRTMEEFMRKIGFAFAGLAAFGLALSLSAPAKAEGAVVVIKSGDQDRDHDRRWHRAHHKEVVVIKHRHRDSDHDRDHDHDRN